MKSKLAKLPSSAKLQGIGCKPTGVDAKDGRPHMLENIGQDEGLEPDKQKEGHERDEKEGEEGRDTGRTVSDTQKYPTPP